MILSGKDAVFSPNDRSSDKVFLSPQLKFSAVSGIFMLFFVLIFFKINTFEIFLQEYQQFQKVSNSLIPDEAGVLSNQKICKGYQQTEPDGKDLTYILL